MSLSNSDVLNEEMRRKTSGSSSQSLIIGLNRFGREKNRTETNRFEPVFGSVRFKKLKNKFGLVVYFGSKPDRTGNAQP